jgi:hypothetical protein
MEISKPRATTGWIYVKRKKTLPGQPGTWDDKKKLEAVTTYLATGNLELTSKMINVPRKTLEVWKKHEWWNETVGQIQSEGALQLSSKLEKVVAKSLDSINDIIANGDYVYDAKRGKVVRVPPKLRDLHRVSSDLIDKQMVLAKKANKHVASEESTEGRLLKLAEQFAKFVQKKDVERVVNEVVEGEFTIEHSGAA